jgi:hypothetical protein
MTLYRANRCHTPVTPDARMAALLSNTFVMM